MKKNGLFYALLFLLVGTFSCTYDAPVSYQNGLVGTWRLYEEGSSPGFGYVITPVPATPAQLLTFTRTGSVVKQGDRLRSFYQAPNYRADSTQLHFVYGTSSDFTVYYAVRNDTLRIAPMCYEGCHYGFVRVK